MNSENFHEYLKNPSKLHQISYQELKSLVLQYPFSPNLRYLLMVKSMFDQNKDYDRNLTLASMYTPDRKQLWKLVKQNSRLKEIRENYELSEEFLELRDLSSLENILEKQTLDIEDLAGSQEKKMAEDLPLSGNASPVEDAADDDLKFLNDDEDLDFLEELMSEPDEVKGETPAPELLNVEDAGEQKADNFDNSQPAEEPLGETSSIEDLVEAGAGDEYQEPQAEENDQAHVVSEEDFLEDLSAARGDEPAENFEETTQTEEVQPAPQAGEQPAPAEPVAPAPLPKDSFRSWRKELQPAKASLLSSSLKSLPVQKKLDWDDELEDDFEDDYPEDEAKHIAEQSVREDEEIVSETLALVLEKQEHYEKAIAMYERLLLHNPKKSSFFAAKIKSLKDKL